MAVSKGRTDRGRSIYPDGAARVKAREAMALERQHRIKWAKLINEQRDRDHQARLVGAALRKAARDAGGSSRRMILAAVRRIAWQRDSGRRCPRIETMAGLAARKPSHIGAEGSLGTCETSGAYVAAVNTGLIATRADRAQIAVALSTWAQQGCDYLVLRHGPHPETLDDVFVDVAVTVDGEVMVRQDLMLFRGLDGSLFAIADHPRLFVRIGPDGLTIEKDAPYADRDERSDGLIRAAAEIVRAARPRRWKR